MTEGEEEEEGGGKSNSKVGTRWVRQRDSMIQLNSMHVTLLRQNACIRVSSNVIKFKITS